MPAEHEFDLAGVSVPEPDHLVAAGGGDPLAVRAECDAMRQGRMAVEREYFPPGCGVPHLHLLTTRGGESPSVRAERDALDRRGVPRKSNMPRCDLSSPVIPFESSAIGPTPTGW